MKREATLVIDLPLYGFVFAGLFSPGPNVILLTASGARFGFRRTVPHILGVVTGVGTIAAVTGFGLGALLTRLPQLAFGLKVIAAAWILFLAWRLLHSTRVNKGPSRDRPFRFYEAVLFQWVNPKLWAVALAASAGYSRGLSADSEAVRLAIAFSGLNLFVCTFWAFAGRLLKKLLSSPKAWTRFMTVMAVALALSAVMIFV